MTKRTKYAIRIISVLLVVSMILMEFGLIPILFNYPFWFMVLSYAMLLITLKKWGSG